LSNLPTAALYLNQSVQEWLKLIYGWEYDKAQPQRALRNIPPRDPYVACAIGDEQMLERLLDSDPDWPTALAVRLECRLSSR
jgi:hypothetical protein